MRLPITPGMRLDEKRALVTGAGRGIGLACAAALAQAGAHVTLAARSADEVEAAADAIRAAGGAATALRLDVTDLSGMQRTIAALPTFHVLANNAGTNRPSPFIDVTTDDFDAVIGINLRAAFFVAQVVARGMIEGNHGGSLIHVGSQMGHVGATARSVYCASKWGLEGMSKAIALDLAARGIRSNTIAPTFIETPMILPYLEDAAFRREVLAKIKLGRLGRVEDLMGAIVYLASDASALVTGTSIVIDGGVTLDGDRAPERGILQREARQCARPEWSDGAPRVRAL